MVLDEKGRWKALRRECYNVIQGSQGIPEELKERVNAYKGGLYESPKTYIDGFAYNDGSWVKYIHKGKLRCSNKEEIGRYLYGYVCFLLKAGIDDLNELRYYSLCLLIDKLEYRKGLFGCSMESRRRIESTILDACKKRPQNVWTAVVDKRRYCQDPAVMKKMTRGKDKKEAIGVKTRVQKKKDKELTDARIAERYDPNLKSIRKNATRCEVSPSRLHQWLKENPQR